MADRSVARTITDFLINDARIGLTFLDLAETTNRAEDRTRRINEAKQAYDTILSFLPRAGATNEQRELLSRELEILKERLEKVGASLSPSSQKQM